jgi:tRNA(Ile)-lysidine synthase
MLYAEYLTCFKEAKRLLIGFSGGLDSSVLLHSLGTHPELKKKVIAIHVNHGLSAYAESWETHCQIQCDALGIPLVIARVVVDARANVEEGARLARYDLFQSLIQVGDCLLLGHHHDDQAETLLLHLFRGAGLDGLAAMQATKPFGLGQLYRPFLSHTRQDLERYAAEHHLRWVEDDSNANRQYSRNFLRQDVIPLLQSRWPGVLTNLTRTASHCQQARQLVDELASMDSPDLSRATLSLTGLKTLSWARISNVLRAWFKNNAVLLPNTATLNRILSEVIRAREDANPIVSWGNYCVRRYQETLYLLDTSQSDETPIICDWASFPEPIDLGKGFGVIKADLSNEGLVIPPGAKLQVRFRQGGETLVWHGQKKSLKKLFQEWKVPTWLRSRIPLLYCDNELAAVVGYAMSDQFYRRTVNSAYKLK